MPTTVVGAYSPEGPYGGFIGYLLAKGGEIKVLFGKSTTWTVPTGKKWVVLGVYTQANTGYAAFVKDPSNTGVPIAGKGSDNVYWKDGLMILPAGYKISAPSYNTAVFAIQVDDGVI